MSEIVLYSTHCPKCNVLEKKLTAKGIAFTVCEDTEVIRNMGYTEVPLLRVNDTVMTFVEANNWINNRG